jgi:hypothetical protein
VLSIFTNISIVKSPSISKSVLAAIPTYAGGASFTCHSQLLPSRISIASNPAELGYELSSPTRSTYPLSTLPLAKVIRILSIAV